jgi:hypothetical protein
MKKAHEITTVCVHVHTCEYVCVCICASVCLYMSTLALCVVVFLPAGIFNQLTDIHKIWYECYAITGYHNIILIHFLQTIITRWQIHTYEVGVT